MERERTVPFWSRFNALQCTFPRWLDAVSFDKCVDSAQPILMRASIFKKRQERQIEESNYK